MNFDSKVTKTFNWLNSNRAKDITAICKKHGGKTNRLAQERGILGVCKIVATFNSFPGWASNNEAAALATTEIIDSGLTNGLTFQN